jgi:hypothetical protein
MNTKKDQKGLIIFSLVFTFIICTTYLVSIYARGYQISFKKGINLSATGLISATSKPKSASVFIDDHLVTATDDTINLSPNNYTIKIAKDGYFPWTKKVTIKKEVVYQTDSHLFRSIPDIKIITPIGSINPTISPDNSKIFFAVASASASKDNGLYQFDLSNNNFPINKSSLRQLTSNLHGIDWSKYTFSVSPNSKQLIATSTVSKISWLINLEEPINQNNIKDISIRKELILQEWENQEKTQVSEKIAKLPPVFKNFISTQSAQNIQFNQSEEKVLYLSSSDFKLTQVMPYPPVDQSTQIQDRDIKKNNWYIYNLKDDTNFIIGSTNDIINPSWLNNSNSIVCIQDKSIKVREYDSTNTQTLFSGKFINNIVYPSINGNQIIILSDLYSPENIQNLYSLTIR